MPVGAAAHTIADRNAVERGRRVVESRRTRQRYPQCESQSRSRLNVLERSKRQQIDDFWTLKASEWAGFFLCTLVQHMFD